MQRRIKSCKCPIEFLYFVKPLRDSEQQNMEAVFISWIPSMQLLSTRLPRFTIKKKVPQANSHCLYRKSLFKKRLCNVHEDISGGWSNPHNYWLEVKIDTKSSAPNTLRSWQVSFNLKENNPQSLVLNTLDRLLLAEQSDKISNWMLQHLFAQWDLYTWFYKVIAV